MHEEKVHAGSREERNRHLASGRRQIVSLRASGRKTGGGRKKGKGKKAARHWSNETGSDSSGTKHKGVQREERMRSQQKKKKTGSSELSDSLTKLITNPSAIRKGKGRRRRSRWRCVKQ